MNRRAFFHAATAGAAAAQSSAVSQPKRFQQWKKLGEILQPGPNDRWDRYRTAPNVVRVGNRLRLYYDGWDQTRPAERFLRRVGVAEADISSPLDFRKLHDEPLVDLGAPGTLDSHWVSYPWVLPITEKHWHMYYAAWGGKSDPRMERRKVWCTTMAESDDAGLTWRRTGRRLIEPGRPYACDEHGTGSCAVLPVGDEHWMWYTAIHWTATDWHRISVALATSKDGGHTFEPHPAGALINVPPVVGAVGSTSSKPYVERSPNGGYRMWYSYAKDGKYYRIHYAESPDGIHFKWWPEPVVDVSASGWDQHTTCYPFVLHLDGRTLMYYNGNGNCGIGVAELISS